MQRIPILILFLFSYGFLSAQFSIESSQVYGGNSLDEAVDIAVNFDSSAIFLGARTFSTDGNIPGSNGGSEFWVMKKNLDGSIVWNRTYGGFNNDDLASVMPHTDGGALIFGTTRNEQAEYGDLKGLAGGWLIRVNAMGNITNGKIFGGDISDNAIDAIRHPNGFVTMAIEASSPELDNQENNGVLDVWIVQVDASFNLRWSMLLGGSLQDSPNALATDINGNIYVAATSNSNLPDLNPNLGGSDVWVIKLAANGEMVWQQTFGGSADDEATDILFDADSNLYVMAHSSSDDNDFNSNRGFNDLWMVRLDAQDGQPEFFKSFGGEGNDLNGNIAKFGKDHLVVSASTNSDSVDISSNKGFNDVWVFTTDLEGNLKREMNYGGSQNDLAGDLITIDSVFYVYNTTLSEDKNVPFNSTSQQDTWLFTLDANTVPCSDQFLCQQDSTLSNELFPPATDVLICVQGCTAGLPAGPDFLQGGCPDFIYGTAYYKLTTDTTADLVTLSVSSDEFNEPHIAILQSGNCSTFTQVACAQGINGSVLLDYIDIEPLTTYIIAISDAAGNEGRFELCASSVDVEFCNVKDTLYVNSTSLGSPFSGPFLPGELVQICYELTDWDKLDCNAFQGLLPTFGPGWDPDGFDFFGMPVQIDSFLMSVSNEGTWDWHKIGDVRYNVTNPISGYHGGQGMPPGWYYTNQADAPPNDGPDQTTGDIFTCLPSPDRWKICFTLPVEDECEMNMDVSVSMRTFSDGELGVNTSLACAYDQAETLVIGMVCCINPTIQIIQDQTICSGDTIIISPETNIIPPVTFSWLSDPDIGIEGASSGMQATQFFQILTNTSTEVLKVNYIIWAEGINCEAEPIIFSVFVNPLPTSRITLTGPNIVCTGTPVTFNFESSGTPPFAIEVTRDDEFFANVLSESSFLSLEIIPQFSGRYRIGKVEDAFCEGEGLGFVNVTVKPLGVAVIDTAICEGGSITYGLETFNEPGNYIVNLDNGAENNCDSIIHLTLEVIPSMTEVISEEICTGDTLIVLGQPYTETTHELIEYIGASGCVDFIQLDLIVRDTFSESVSQTICHGDSLEFGGVLVFQTGSYSHVEEISPGCFGETVLNLTVLPAIVINDLVIISDNGTNNGAIAVEIVGGTPPFTFEWSTNATTESLFNIMHGNYSLTVTDRQGCTQQFHFVVPMSTSSNDPTYERIILMPTLISGEESIRIVYENQTSPITEISWMDTNGRFIFSDIVEVTQENIWSCRIPQPLQSGIYFLHIGYEDGHASWHKIVKQ